MRRSAEPRSHVRSKSADTAEAPERRGVGPHHARGLRSHRVARTIGMAMTGVLAFVGTAAAAVVIQSNSHITTMDIDNLIMSTPSAKATKNPDDPYAGQPLNILLVGTDYRDAENAAIAGADEGGMRSDTTLVIHISGNRKWIEVFSIPRDSLVSIPSCKLPDGSMSQPRTNTMFNAAFDIGADNNPDETTAMTYATACTYNTVENLTGIDLTNYVALKMTGVIGVVNALGGVTMCFDTPVVGSKKYSPDLDIPAGRQTLDGRTAIAFLRARKGTGMGLDQGSDLARIERQQAFIDSTLTQMLSGNLMTNTPKLYQVLQEALKSTMPDKQLGNLSSDVGLAYSLRNLSSAHIVFTPIPVADAPSDPNRVVITSGAQEIWDRIAADQPPASIAAEVTTATTPSADANTGADAGTGTGAGDTGAGDTGAGTDAGTGTDTGAGGSDAGAGTDTGTPAPTDTPTHLPGVCYDGWQPSGS